MTRDNDLKGCRREGTTDVIGTASSPRTCIRRSPHARGVLSWEGCGGPSSERTSNARFDQAGTSARTRGRGDRRTRGMPGRTGSVFRVSRTRRQRGCARSPTCAPAWRAHAKEVGWGAVWRTRRTHYVRTRGDEIPTRHGQPIRAGGHVAGQERRWLRAPRGGVGPGPLDLLRMERGVGVGGGKSCRVALHLDPPGREAKRYAQ